MNATRVESVCKSLAWLCVGSTLYWSRTTGWILKRQFDPAGTLVGVALAFCWIAR